MDNKKLIDDKLIELDPLYKTMDEAEDLIFGEWAGLKNPGGQAYADVFKVICNDAAVHTNAIMSDLVSSSWQLTVGGDGVTKTTISAVEGFGNALTDQMDESIFNRTGKSGGIYATQCARIVTRVWLGKIIQVSIKDGKFFVDVKDLDMRYCPFEYGEWAAPIYWRSEAACMKEWWYKDSLKLDSKKNEIRNFWNKDVNEIYVAGNKVAEQQNTYGVLPFVITLPVTGFELRGEDYLENDAPSVIWLNRDLYTEKNAILSIAKTKALNILFPGQEQEKESPTDTADPIPGVNQVQVVPKGGRHQPVNQLDLNQAYGSFKQDIETLLAQGGLNKIDLGNMSEGASALLVTTQSQIRDKFTRPLLDALARDKAGDIRLAIQEYQALAGTESSKPLEIGSTGMKKRFSPAQLGDPSTYYIKYRGMINDPKQDIANIAVSNAAAQTLPLEYRLENIIKVEDPPAIIRKLRIEQLANADPIAALLVSAIDLSEEAETKEGVDAEVLYLLAKRATERACSMMKQAAMPQQGIQEAVSPKPQMTQKPNSQGISALGANPGALR